MAIWQSKKETTTGLRTYIYNVYIHRSVLYGTCNILFASFSSFTAAVDLFTFLGVSNDDGPQGTSLDIFPLLSVANAVIHSNHELTASLISFPFSHPRFLFHIFKNETYIRIVLMMALTRFFSISLLFILFPSRFQCCWVSLLLSTRVPDDEIFRFPCRAPFPPPPLLSDVLFAHPLSRKPAASSQGNLSHYLSSFGKLLQLWYHH